MTGRMNDIQERVNAATEGPWEEKHGHPLDVLATDGAWLLDRVAALETALAKVRRAAETKDWMTDGHPMNEWTKRESILRIVDDALGSVPVSETAKEEAT